MYHHVLWIIWDEERKAARRGGPGWVFEDEWDRMDTKWVDVVL